MLYNYGKPTRYFQIESAVSPILFDNQIDCYSVRAESQTISDMLLFSITRESDDNDISTYDWQFAWDEIDELKEHGREPILLMKANKYSDTLLSVDKLEVNPKFRGLGINSTMQEFLPDVLTNLSINYMLHVGIHDDLDLTSYSIKQNRYALYEIQDIIPKFDVLDNYYFMPANLSIGFNPNYDKSEIVKSKFVGLDVHERLVYYHLLGRFVNSVSNSLNNFYYDPAAVSVKDRKFLFNILDVSGFNNESVEQIKSHSIVAFSNKSNFIVFQNFKMYFAENYYQISQRIGMMTL